MTTHAQPTYAAIAIPDLSPGQRRLRLFVEVIDLLLGIAVGGLIVFATVAFGTVKPWSELIAIQAGAGIAAALALRVLIAGGLPKTAAYLPIVAFLAIVALQMTTLPAWLVGAISPRTLADKSRLLSDLPGSAQRLRQMTISYYLPGTYHDLRIILLDIVAFLTVLVIARTPRRILALLIGFSVVAAALALEALLQNWKNAPNILWINGADTLTNSGPFVNHSDFSQQMNNLCGWVLALILVAAGTAWPKDAWGRGWRIAGICLLAVVFIGGVIATLYSKSRGGITCIIIGTAVVILGLVSRRGKQGLVWLIVVVACAGLGTALFAGFDSIYNRMLSIANSDEYAARVSNVKDIISISRHYPLLGTGLGTHAVFFPRYETNATYAFSTHAEVEYAQALEETGYIGLACVVLFAGIVWVYWKRGVVSAAEPITIAAIGLGFGLAAVEAQSFSDFGQHLPSLGCLTAVTIAMLINLGQARSWRRAGRAPISLAGWASTMMGRAAFAAVLLGAAGWCLLNAARVNRAQNLFEKSDVLETFMESNPWYRTPQSNADVLAKIQAAIDAEPLEIDFYVAQGWDRWAALTTPLGSGSPEPQPDFVPSTTVDPNHPDLDKVRQIADALNEARWTCPTYGPICTLVGDMELDPLHEPIGAAHVRLGVELAPHNLNALLLAAKLDAREGLWEDAARLSRTLMRIRPDYAYPVISFYASEMHRPDLALKLRPDDYHFLQLVAANTGDTSVQQSAAARIKELLIAACNGPNPTGEELAELGQIRWTDGDLRAAADLYKRAIAQDYGQIPWHLALAKILLQSHDPAGAQAEAGICLHLQPGLQAAKDLLDEMSSMPP